MILSRDGKHVAVIGGKRYGVGDKVGGSRIVKITGGTIFFAQ